MCSGAALLYKIPRIVVGENVTFQGPEAYVRSQGVQVIFGGGPADVRALTVRLGAEMLFDDVLPTAEQPMGHGRVESPFLPPQDGPRDQARRSLAKDDLARSPVALPLRRKGWGAVAAARRAVSESHAEPCRPFAAAVAMQDLPAS